MKRRLRKSRTGAVLVEAALVLPIVILFIIGVFDYGRYLLTLHVVDNAAREGAAYASKHTSPIVLGSTTYGNATSDVTNVITSKLAGVQLGSQTVSVYESDSKGNNLGAWTGATAGQCVCVQITGNFVFTATKLLSANASVPVSVKAVKRSEGN
jgi:Flp pilus assembly protein TadG